MRNFFSVGNTPIEMNLDTHKTTLVVGKNSYGKCAEYNTPIKVRDKETNKVYEIMIGDLYNTQKKQNGDRKS